MLLPWWGQEHCINLRKVEKKNTRHLVLFFKIQETCINAMREWFFQWIGCTVWRVVSKRLQFFFCLGVLIKPILHFILEQRSATSTQRCQSAWRIWFEGWQNYLTGRYWEFVLQTGRWSWRKEKAQKMAQSLKSTFLTLRSGQESVFEACVRQMLYSRHAWCHMSSQHLDTPRPHECVRSARSLSHLHTQHTDTHTQRHLHTFSFSSPVS